MKTTLTLDIAGEKQAPKLHHICDDVTGSTVVIAINEAKGYEYIEVPNIHYGFKDNIDDYLNSEIHELMGRYPAGVYRLTLEYVKGGYSSQGDIDDEILISNVETLFKADNKVEAGTLYYYITQTFQQSDKHCVILDWDCDNLTETQFFIFKSWYDTFVKTGVIVISGIEFSLDSMGELKHTTGVL